MTAFMQYLGYAIAFGCVLFAAHFLTASSVKRMPSLFLGAAFLIFAVQSALLSILLGSGQLPVAAIARPTLAMTIGPILLLYFTSAADPDFKLRKRSILHFLPAALIAFELVGKSFWIDIDLAIIASFAAYMTALWLKVQRGSAQFAHIGAGQRDAFRILIAGAVLLSASLVGEIVIAFEIMHGGGVSTSIPLMIALIFDLAVISIAILAALQRPSAFDWQYSFGAPRKGGDAATMTDAECGACVVAFEAYINDSDVFDGEAIGLSAMAKRLAIPPRRLSESINRICGENYSRRMNRWRVEKAARLLRERPDASVTEIMFDAGFRTKSSFNREFRMLHGISPTEYRNSAEKTPLGTRLS